jgi:DNA-binding LytR/AlgR family response regulator
MKLNCIVIDDEFPARELVKNFVEKLPNLHLMGSFKSPLEAMDTLQDSKVDLMFLDIQMPDITGVDFLKTLQKKPLVVFTTAYMEYAIEGYELDVLDYLVKPFSFERFIQAVNKACERFASPSSDSPVVKDTKAGDQKDYIMVKADYKIFRIKFEDLTYVEGLREYVTFFVKDEKIVSLESLRKLEVKLPQSHFLRVHKSYIVNLEKVEAIYGNQLKMEHHSQYIPIGKSYKDVVIKRLMS